MKSRHKFAVDSGWSWVVMLASYYAHLLLAGLVFSFGVYAVALIEELGESRARVALLGALPPALMCLLGPVASILSHKLGCRLTVILGGLVSGIGHTVSFVAPNLNTLLMTYGCLTGIGAGLVYTPAVASVGMVFDRKRKIALAIATSGAGVGCLLFPLILQYMVDLFSWRGAMLIAGGLAFNMCVCGALIRPLPEPFKIETQRTGEPIKKVEIVVESFIPETSDVTKTPYYQCEEKFKSIKKDHVHVVVDKIRTYMETVKGLYLLKKISFLAFISSSFLYIGSAYVVLVMLNDFVTSQGIDPDNSTFIMSLMGVFNMLGRLMTGAVGMLKVDSLHIFYFSLVLMGTITMIIPMGKIYILYALLASAFGLAFGMSTTSVPGVLTELYGAHSLLHAFGYVNFAHGIGGLVCPPIAGALYDNTQSFFIMFIFGGSLSLCSAILLYAGLYGGKRWKKSRIAKRDSQVALKENFVTDDMDSSDEENSEAVVQLMSTI